MKPFARIIVDLDATAVAHPALARGLDLARFCGAALTLVDVVTVPASARAYLPRGAEELIVATRQDRIKALAAAIRDVPATAELLEGRPAQALIAAVIATGCDLVIRSHARDLAATPRALGSVDMQLFRYCPCTVWAAGPQAQSAPKVILAAVHADRQNPEEQRLNERILETAHLMARASRGRLIVLQAWHAFAEEMLQHRYSPADLAAYLHAAEDSARVSLDALTSARPDLAREADVELIKGQPEDVIPGFVVSHGVDLVVMGTVARTGLQGLIMGNTAERLLQRLPCSVMAVKPEGFVPPGT